MDIAEVFTDRKERELRDGVMKKAGKLMKDVFGYQVNLIKVL